MDGHSGQALARAALLRAVVFAVPPIVEWAIVPGIGIAPALAAVAVSAGAGGIAMYDPRMAPGPFPRWMTFVPRSILMTAAMVLAIRVMAAPGAPRVALALLIGLVLGAGLYGSNRGEPGYEYADEEPN